MHAWYWPPEQLYSNWQYATQAFFALQHTSSRPISISAKSVRPKSCRSYRPVSYAMQSRSWCLRDIIYMYVYTVIFSSPSRIMLNVFRCKIDLQSCLKSMMWKPNSAQIDWGYTFLKVSVSFTRVLDSEFDRLILTIICLREGLRTWKLMSYM